MRDDNCIFCKLANGTIPTTGIYEDEIVRVIPDAGPASFGHLLVIPKEHYANLCELDDAVAAHILPLAKRIGKAMMKTLGCAGFNLVQNNGAAAGQTVMHFHLHIIPRYEGEEEMILWKPGTLSSEKAAEIAAKLVPEI